MSENLRKLNVGCGGQNLPGYINLDIREYPHTHIFYDLERGGKARMHFSSNINGKEFIDDEIPPWGKAVPDDFFDRILISHVFEHVTNVLGMMQELWRVAKPGCSCVIITPYGSSDSADEDPTHVRRIFKDSMSYFSQAWYGRNDYGYRGDWDYKKRLFMIKKEFRGLSDEDLGKAVAMYRNVVDELHSELVAVKPLREPGFEIAVPSTAFKFV